MVRLTYLQISILLLFILVPLKLIFYVTAELDEFEDSTLLGDADEADVDDEFRPDVRGGRSGAESTAGGDGDELGAAIADTPHVDAVLRLFKQRAPPSEEMPSEQWPSASSAADSSASQRAAERRERQGSRHAPTRSAQVAHSSERRRRSHTRRAEEAGAREELVQGAPQPLHRDTVPSHV